ncbi:MAG: TonB-dependent receptor [Niveispirillum sp.]|uniref:TonB-dependent receptor n=1 Tax=Niveispirillum sp. TaxID=1917217 RepID=UPI0040372C87
MKNFLQDSLVRLLATVSVAALAHSAYAQTAAGDQQLEEIIVTGMRASLQTNAMLKKNAIEVVDSITANDIGKLPDPSVAETLTRVPGVQAYRFGGEAASPVGVGSGITVRGLTGQTASRVNGRAYFTAGQREFNIEGMVPAIVAGVDVFKNPTAEHIEGGIGGVVNVRTRRPLEMKGTTATLSVGGRYNDLSEDAEPEMFGLVSQTWDVGDGEIGVMLAGGYMRTVNRGDNTPGAGGISYRRAINAASAEYAAGAASGLYNSAYVGRSDVNYLANVTPSSVTGDRSGLIAVLGENPTIGWESYVRTRKGVNGMVQYKPNPDLELYAEGLYNFYRYDQEYGFLGSSNSRYVRNLTTTPFQATEGLTNRNINGGADELLAGRLLTGGTFLGSGLSITEGGNHVDYETTVVAGGGKWQAADNLEVAFDLTYVKADRNNDGRGLTFASAPGLSWDLTRDLSTRPTSVTIGGPDVAAATTWNYNQYGTYPNTWRDNGIAAKADITRSFDDGFLENVKFGVRYATQNDTFRDFTLAGKNLTTNGLALAANGSNAISMGSVGTIIATPNNFMDGKMGYAGGYLIFDPHALYGDTIKNLFPQAGILTAGTEPEIAVNNRRFEEKSYAGYGMASFRLMDDAIKGNAGVRIVKTDTYARAQVSTSTGIVPNEATSSYTDVLPTLNIIGNVSEDTLIRFGYGKGITRPDPQSLNPSIVVNAGSGTASVGNPDLKPQKGDSFDLSFEHYISGANYASIGFFYKKVDGFFSQIATCEAVSGFTYTGAILNGCSGGQYLVTRTVNAQQGWAKGVEVAAQSFLDYDFVPEYLHNFGASASFTYVDTKNPVLLSSGVLVNSVQPFTSKYNYSLTGMYEDEVMSARIVYTYRSRAQFTAIGLNPVDSRYIQAFGLLDASLNFNLPEGFQISLTASNLTNAAPNRFYGEPGYYTGVERQHYVNGRVFGAALRWKFGG